MKPREAGGQPAQGDAYSEQVESVREALYRRASFTETMRKMLEYGRDRCSFADMEHQIATFPEFRYIEQSQASLIQILIDAGALNKYELDARGSLVSRTQKMGMADDQIDDLVCSFELETTIAGVMVIEDLNPRKRLASLFEASSERVPFYSSVMRFCTTPKEYRQVEAEFGRTLNLTSNNTLSSLPLFPSALLGELEAAGGLVWDEGWLITVEGSDFLEDYQRQRV